MVSIAMHRRGTAKTAKGVFVVVILAILAAASIAAAADATATGGAEAAGDWKAKLKAELPLLGHRNWIVVADSAYPAQKGVETIYVGGDQATAVREVLKILDGAKHVRANMLFDKELKFLNEEDAPGVQKVRDELNALGKERNAEAAPHELILQDVARAAAGYRVIVLKTDETIPYTSVFLPLDCGYWSKEAQVRLERRIIEGGEGRPRRAFVQP